MENFKSIYLKILELLDYRIIENYENEIIDS